MRVFTRVVSSVFTPVVHSRFHIYDALFEKTHHHYGVSTSQVWPQCVAGRQSAGTMGCARRGNMVRSRALRVRLLRSASRIVTFAFFTCHLRCILKGRTKENQPLGTLKVARGAEIHLKWSILGECDNCPEDTASPERRDNAARTSPKLNLRTVDAVAGIFPTQAERQPLFALSDGDDSPALLVCHGSPGPQMVHARAGRRPAPQTANVIDRSDCVIFCG